LLVYGVSNATFCCKFTSSITAHNPEINWETGEVKMTRCLPLCERNLTIKENIEQRKKVRKRIKNIEKADRNK